MRSKNQKATGAEDNIMAKSEISKASAAVAAAKKALTDLVAQA